MADELVTKHSASMTDDFVKASASMSDDIVSTFKTHVKSNASAEHFSKTKSTALPLQERATVLDTSAEAEEPFEVHTMLLWATRAATSATGQIHPDYHRRSDADHFGLEVTPQCVPAMLQATWREGFTSAIDMMLQKTMHGMQHGLLQVAHSVAELIEGTSCGLLAHAGFEKLAEQAERLQVLASAGSLNDLDVTVKYEPLKALTVGGVDIHVELNELIIAWQLNKGPEEMGRALAAFLRDFRDDSAEVAPTDASVGADSEASSQGEELHESRTPRFWTEVLQTAMLRLGGDHELMSEACLSAATARRYGDALEDGIARMLEKTRRGMQSGIQEVATATIAFVDSLHAPCSEAVGAVHLRSAATRLRVFASAKTLIDFAQHVEYEPMKVLKVGGIDVHKELNRFLVAWIHNGGASELAHGLVDFFEDFKEHEVAEEPVSHHTGESDDGSDNSARVEEEAEPEVLAILRDAISPASTGSLERDAVLAEGCLSEAMSQTFTERVEKALEHMLQKRKRTMQLGLKELADLTDDMFGQMAQVESGCVLSQDVSFITDGARKLRRLTRKTVVDYGTHIKYEAMKGLIVGDVDIHIELNEFIGAWKLRSPREAGVPFGELMRKLATIRGHDEL